MKREIKLSFNTDQELIRLAVDLFQPILNLRKREADVLAQLLWFNNTKRDITNLTDRFELIFSSKTRKAIMENLNINDSVLQNTFSILRKKKIIVNNQIPVKYHFYIINGDLELTFKLKTTK